jgi:TolB-like protein/DNA-binding SARP family transcriptional activator/Flp pilus assembly protein TadD
MRAAIFLDPAARPDYHWRVPPSHIADFRQESHTAEVLDLRFFGGACIIDESGPLRGPLAQRRRLALLALLAASPNGRMAREKLCGYLWPENREEDARASVVDAIYALRKGLGRDVLLSMGDEIRLNPERIGSDVQRFRTAFAAGDHEQAVGLYTGPFLDGFFVPGADEFERWTEAERQLRTHEYARALEALAARYDAAGEAAGAVDVLLRLSRHDPYSSRVALTLMRALAAAGDREAAVHHATAFQRLLHDDLGAEPDPAVLTLAERLRCEPACAGEIRAAAPSGGAALASNAPTPVEPAAGSVTQPKPAASAQAGDAAAAPAGDAAAAPAGDAAAAPATAAGARRLRPVAMAAVLFLAAASAFTMLDRELRNRHATEAPGLSVAVLPFVDLSPEGDQAWFTDGVTDELISALVRMEGIRVAARTSVYAYRGRNLPVREVGRQLQVRYVLEGSARRLNGRVRVTAQLVEVRNGFPLWATTLDRDLGDLLTLQRELALGIARSLELELGSTDGSPGTRDPAAYDDYLQGRYHWTHGSVTDSRTQEQAIAFFGSAVERDPGFARAYAGLADAYSHAGQPELARKAALQALALDSTLSEARTALAYPLAFHEWRWQEAERELSRAIALDPHAVLPYVRRANVLAALGRTEEAIADVEHAARMEPLSFLVSYNRGLIYYWGGRYDEAVRFLRHTLAMDSMRLDVRRELAHAHFGRGDMDQAAALYRSIGDTVFAHLATGSTAQLEALLRDASTLITPAARAKLYARLGRHDDALRELQAAVNAADRWIPFQLVFPGLAPLRDHPHFARLRQQVGLQSAPAPGPSDAAAVRPRAGIQPAPAARTPW